LAATGQRGLGAIILSHADYPHAANVNAFRREWGEIDVIVPKTKFIDEVKKVIMLPFDKLIDFLSLIV